MSFTISGRYKSPPEINVKKFKMAALGVASESQEVHVIPTNSSMIPSSAVDPGCVKILSFYCVHMRNCWPFPRSSFHV